MRNIVFRAGRFQVTTFIKGNLTPEVPVCSSFATSDKPLGIRAHDELTLFLFDPIAERFAVGVYNKEDLICGNLKKDASSFIARPIDTIAYIGPSLNFAHYPIERSETIRLYEAGYEAALKRSEGQDYFDAIVFAHVELRALGLKAKNIFEDNHDPSDSNDLLYSARLGDKEKNLSIAEILP